MKYKLEETLNQDDEKVILTEDSLNSITKSIEVLSAAVEKMSVEIKANSQSITALSTSTDNKLIELKASLEKQIKSVNDKVDSLDLNPQEVSATSIDASEIQASSASATNASVETLNAKTGDITNLSSDAATIKQLKSNVANADEANITNANIVNANITNLSLDEVNCSKLGTSEINSGTASINSLTTNEVKSSSTISVLVNDNTQLAVLEITGGVAILTSADGTIVATPNNVFSDNNKLYAVDGNKLYFDEGGVFKALTIGEVSITQSVVDKDNIQRNTDSNGAVNNGGDLKAVVVNKLPQHGMKNMIYIVAGDSSYYSDGNNYYPMTSKYEA